MKPNSWIVVSVLAAALLVFVAGCDDDPGESAESIPSPMRTPESPVASTPVPPATPVVNIQFFGATDLSDESKSSLADLIERIRSGVVQITTGSGSGSGFIVDAGGLVITNEHVVSGETNVGVSLTNGRRHEGDVLARDAASDLALVQINRNGSFDAIPVGDPSRVRVGDEVLALGFPLADRIGTNLTVTRGIISSIRTVNGVQLFQTDAALNPGNSGGPLVNSAGEVIGVSSSKIEETAGGRPVSNIGFAVSVSEVERRLSTLRGDSVTNRGTATPTPTIPPTPPVTLAPTVTPTQTVVPIPTITPTPTPYPEGLDVHGYEQFIYRFEALGFVFEVSTKDELKQVTGTKDDSLVKTRFEEVPAISHICALPYVGVVYGTETVYCTPARVRLF